MSKQDSNSKKKENQVVNRYIYKLTLSSGKTYIGQRTYKSSLSANTDSYKGSSTYIKRNSQDTIIKKEILIENIKDQDTLNFLETWCILSDKVYNKKNNINGTLGGFIYRYTRDFKFKKKNKTDIEKQVDSFLKNHGVLIRNLNTNEVKYQSEWRKLKFVTSSKNLYFSKGTYFCREDYFIKQNKSCDELMKEYNEIKLNNFKKGNSSPRKRNPNTGKSIKRNWDSLSKKEREYHLRGLRSKETLLKKTLISREKYKNRKNRFECLGKISTWVVINDIVYLSINEASEIIKCSDSTLKRFLDNKNSRLKIEGFYFPKELKSLYLENNCPMKYSDFKSMIN